MPYQVSNFFAVGWTQNDRIQKYPLTLIFLYSFTLIYSFFPYYHSIIVLFLSIFSVQKVLFQHVLWL
jgi:hypothetical protein